jgi:hypothetical protein
MSMRRGLRQLGFAAFIVAGALVTGCSSDGTNGPDTSAPAAPTGLRAATVEGGARGVPAEHFATIQLDWDHNQESDLAGYNLYSSKDGGAYELSGIIPAGTATFQDVRERGHDFAYMVKAVDQSENESMASNGVSLRAPLFPPTGESF